MIANRITLNADPCHPYTPAYVGLYENVFTIGTKQRRMLTYIPEDTKSSTSGIYLFPPNGVTAEQFLTESNWIDIADGEEHREKLVLRTRSRRRWLLGHRRSLRSRRRRT